MRAFFDSMSSFTASALTEGLNRLNDAGGNLTNSLEAEMVGYGQTARRTVAMLGLTGEAASSARGEIAGLAYSMRVGADTVASNFTAIEEATGPVGEALAHMRLDLESLTQVTEVFGIQGDQLTGVLGDLTQSWDFSSAAAGDFLDRMVATAQTARLGRESFGIIEQSLQLMDEHLASSSLERTPEEIERTALSIMQVSGAFREFGLHGDELRSQVGQIFQTLAQETVAFERGLRGNNADMFGPMSSALNELVGLDVAQTLMHQDPSEFMMNMSSLMMDGSVAIDGQRVALQGLSQDGLARLRDAMNDTMGQSATFMLTSENGARALANMVQPAQDAEGALRRVGEQGFSTGITLQESLDRAKLSFETRFRSISRGAVEDFVSDQRRAYRGVGNMLVELGDDKRWGPLVQRLSAVQQIGMAGFFVDLADDGEEASDSMNRFAAIMSLVTDGAMDAVVTLVPLAQFATGFAPILQRVWSVARPIVALFTSWPVMLAAAVVGTVMFHKEIKDFLDDGMGLLGDWADSASDWLNSLNPAELAGKLADWLEAIPSTIASIFSGGGDGGVRGEFMNSMWGLFNSVSIFLQQFAPVFGQRLWTMSVNALDWLIARWPKWRARLLEMLGGAFDWVVERVPGWMTALWEKLVEGGSWLVEHAPEIGQFILDGLMESWEWLKDRWETIRDNIVEPLRKAVLDAVARIPDWFTDLPSGEGIGASIRDWAAEQLAKIDWGGILESVGETAIDMQLWWDNAMDKIRDVDPGALIAKASDWVAGLIRGMFSGDGAEQGVSGFVEWFKEDGLTILGGIISNAGEFAWTLIEFFGEAIAGLAVGAWTLYQAVNDVTRDIFLGALGMVKDFLVEYLVSWMDEVFWEPISQWIGTKVDEMGQLWHFLIAEPFNAAMEWFSGLPDLFMEKVWDPLKAWFLEKAVDFYLLVQSWIVDPFNAALDWFRSLPETIGTLVEENIITPFDEMSERLRESGAAIVDNIKAGILEKWDGLVSWFRDRLQTLRDMWPLSEPRDHTSPLTHLDDSGAAMLNNVMGGIRGAMRPFTDEGRSLLSGAADSMMDAFITQTTGSVIDRMSSMVGSLGRVLAGMLNMANIVPMMEATMPIETGDLYETIIARADVRDIIVAIEYASLQQVAVLTDISERVEQVVDNTRWQAAAARVTPLRAG